MAKEPGILGGVFLLKLAAATYLDVAEPFA